MAVQSMMHVCNEARDISNNSSISGGTRKKLMTTNDALFEIADLEGI